MDYTIKAIPTTYKGIEFRSRLEAKWAAFFDLCGWRWEYEPCDFDGWIPDFQLYLGAKSPFVEVKPISDPVQWGRVFDAEIKRSPKNGVLLVGISPLSEGQFPAKFSGYESLGLFVYPGDGSVVEISLFGVCQRCKNRTIVSQGCGDGYELCWSCGRDGYEAFVYCDSALKKWASACNQTKWRPRP